MHEGTAGSTTATFQEVARAELPGLYALARRLADDDAAAEDLVQEALLRAYRGFASLHDPATAPRWLRVILTNVWRDGIRKRHRSPREVSFDGEESFSLYQVLVEEDPDPYSDTMHLDFLGSFSEDDVRAVLRSLPELYRVALVLRYVEGFATKEIGRLLDVPLGTVLARLHRGRKLFEKALWEFSQNAATTAGGVSGVDRR